MKRSLIALALAAVLPLSAQAGELSNTYVQGEFMDIDNVADGFGVRGAYEFGESNFYVFGGYRALEIDGTNLDIDALNLGLGYAWGVTDSTDLIGEVSYIDADVDGAADFDGYRVSVGVRGDLSERFEGLAKVNYSDTDELLENWTFTVGTQYKFNNTWGLVGEIEFGDDSESYLFGVRASF